MRRRAACTRKRFSLPELAPTPPAPPLRMHLERVHAQLLPYEHEAQLQLCRRHGSEPPQAVGKHMEGLKYRVRDR